MATRSNAYWERRARQRMADYHRRGDAVVRQITRAYDKGRRDIEDAIERIFGKFMRDGALDPDEAIKLLNEPISRKEWERIREQYRKVKDPKLRRRLLNYLNAPAYRARITRLQALQANIYIQSKIIADVEISQSSQFYMDTLNQAYYRTMFDIQRGIGYGFAFAAMPSRTVQEILRRPWSGSHFSTRVWENTDVLVRHVTDVITAGMKSGASMQKMRDELAERMNSGKHAANRLIRTETTYVANAAEIESYKEAEIAKYIFVATLDLRTSEICRDMDLRVFDVSKAEPGKNLPPMHPYCRSTTIAYFSQRSLDRIQRRARDPKTGRSVLVPAGMNYKQWYNEYVASSLPPKTRKLHEDSSLPKALRVDRSGDIWIPSNAVIENVHVIAGKGVATPIRAAESLVKKYGGKKEDWEKAVGLVKSDKYEFDIHWYQNGDKMVEHKIKSFKERRK